MSLYFCTASIFTVGYSDYTVKTRGPRAFVMIFCVVGVIIVGLVVAMIRQVVLSSTAPCIFWYRIERRREQFLR